MTVAIKTLRATTSPDGTNDGVIKSFSPGADELYYIEDAFIFVNETGPDLSLDADFIVETHIVPDAGLRDDGKITDADVRRTRAEVGKKLQNPNRITLEGTRNARTTLGQYLPPSEEILIREDVDVGASTAELEIVFNMRRIL